VKINQLTHTTYLIVSIFLIFSLAFLSAQRLEASNKNHGSSKSPIRIAMTAAFVSESGIDVYKDISNYIADNLNQEVNFVSGFSYKTVNEMIDQNVVDLAFVCGLPYILKRDINHPTIQLLAAPVMQAQRYKDKPIYYSDIIVHKDSPYKNFNDLANTIFVYNDEISNSGYNMPRAHLISKKKTNGYFKKILRSGSHEESIRMIAKGEADVSAIDSLVLDYEIIR